MFSCTENHDEAPAHIVPAKRRPLFTVFTPTFNRKHTLPRLYASLREQTFRDFEWLIVDDGSTDGTDELVAEWLATPSFFPIRYVRQEHGHKKTAVNRGARLAEGELFAVIDSDDELVPHALAVLARAWHALPEDRRCRYVSVVCLCQDAAGQIVGEPFPSWSLAGVPAISLLTKLRGGGERWECIRAEVMRRFPYPDNIPGHVPEATGQLQRVMGFDVLCLNEPLRIYHQDAGSQLSRHSDPADVAPGHLYYRKEVLDYPWQIVRHRLVETALDAAQWARFRLHVAQRFRGRSAEACGVAGWLPRSSVGRALIVLMSPLGLLLWCRDVFRRTRSN